MLGRDLMDRLRDGGETALQSLIQDDCSKFVSKEGQQSQPKRRDK